MICGCPEMFNYYSSIRNTVFGSLYSGLPMETTIFWVGTVSLEVEEQTSFLIACEGHAARTVAVLGCMRARVRIGFRASSYLRIMGIYEVRGYL